MTAADRPSVTDNARAAMHPVVTEHQIIGTQTGKQGAGQVVPEDSVLCIKCGWMRCSDYTWHLSDALAAGRAETTTATAEDTDLRDRLQAVVAPVVAPYTSGPMDPLDVQVADAVMGLLATARTVNVHPTYTVEYQQKIADELGVEREAVLRALGLAAPLLATARTATTATTEDAAGALFDQLWTEDRDYERAEVREIFLTGYGSGVDAAAGLLATARTRPTEGTRWWVPAYRTPNSRVQRIGSPTVLREYAEREVEQYRAQEAEDPEGNPAAIFLATRVEYPWTEVDQ